MSRFRSIRAARSLSGMRECPVPLEVEGLALSALDMVSGTGHDAVHLAANVPIAMIVIPSRAGLSHNEREANLSLRSTLRVDEHSILIRTDSHHGSQSRHQG